MPNVRNLPPKTIAILIAGIVLLIGAGTLVMHYTGKRSDAKVATESVASGSFLPTKGQLEALKIVTVSAMDFRGEQITDGMIATNDDTATPVFSPFSGRVTKLFAKLGDVVAKGAPLMAVEASEFVQGQNDLISAVGALTASA